MIYMNKRAYEAISDPKAVALYYNREEDAIAMEPAFELSDESLPVVVRLNGWAVHGGGFCRHFGIQIPKTQRFIRTDITNEGQLILPLRETVTVGGYVKGRTRKSKSEQH
jgi:hypothetical protein